MAITREYLAELCDARDKICGFCEANQCEKCIVTNLINDAFAECVDIEESEEDKLSRTSEGPFECMSEYCAYNP